MKVLFSDKDLKELLAELMYDQYQTHEHGLEPIDIAMCDSEIHRQEVSWQIGLVCVYATIVCVRETIHEPDTYEEDGYSRTDDGVYQYHFEIDDMLIELDGERFTSYQQEDQIIMPLIQNAISVSH